MFVATGAAGMLIFLLALLFLREPPSPAATATAPVSTHVRQSLLAVIGNRRTWVIAVISLLYYVPVNVYGGLWGTTELVRNHHVSPVTAETLVSLIFWGITVGQRVRRLAVRPARPSQVAGLRRCAVHGAGLCRRALAARAASGWKRALLFAAGFFGGPQMLTFAMAKEGQANRLTGTVVAFVNMIGIAGAMIFQPLVGYLADLGGGDFRLALTVVPLCAGLAAVLVLFLPEYRHPEHRPGARRPT